MKIKEFIFWVVLVILWISFILFISNLSDCMNKGRLERVGEWDSLKTFQECTKI